MTVRDIATTAAGMVALAASSAAAMLIWLLLTRPMTLYPVMLRVIRFL